MPDNIFQDAESRICLSLIEKYFSAPKAKYDKRRNEYFTLSPLRADDNVKAGTFSINVDTGLYNDLATGDSGNFIQLVAKKFGISKLDAAKKIIHDSGGVTMDDKQKDTKAGTKAGKEKKPDAIIPIPQGCDKELQKIVQSDYNLQLHGKAVRIYIYKNYDGDAICCVCRYEREVDGKKDKEHIPYFYTKNGWRAGRPNIKNFPLYNENKLKGNDLPVLIVEGEKCASVKVEGYVVISWLGGPNSIPQANFDILLNKKKITIWPDADHQRDMNTHEVFPWKKQPGTKAAYSIKKILKQAEILDVKDKAEITKGWDIFDAQSEGINLVSFIQTCPRLLDAEFPTTPYEAFVRVIDDLYEKENLEQFDGLFYIYKKNEHHWKERLIINFESDVQKWIEKNMIQYLSETETAIHTFMKNTISLLKHYSTGYYNGNPFKNSALQPYIHVRNGAIEITETGFIFHDREKLDEDFFKKLYPLYALDFDFNMKYYIDADLKELAPTFYYYIQSLVPKPEFKTPDAIAEYNKELETTLIFFSMVLAYTLNPVKRRPYFFALYGGQDTGKSFFVDLLETIIGAQFFVTRKIKDMIDNRFAAYDLWGAKVYYDDDVKANITLPDDFIKFFSGQKQITVEPKFGAAIKGVKISVAMYFLSNHAFTVAGGAEGLERRLIYIPYKKRLKNPDTLLLEKIIGKKPKGDESGTNAGKVFDERPAIIGFALRGIESLIKNNHNFIMPNWIAEERKDWLIKSNTISQFLHEIIFPGTESSYPSKELYEKYKDWCKDEESRKPYGKNKFYEMLKLEPRVDHKHYSTGDYFKFDLDVKSESDMDNIPF